MPKLQTINNKRGFTIIEVVLVLAIAGLIFLMVFLALPALQRSQKDTQRRDQLSMFITQLSNFQANNRNRVPVCSTSGDVAACNIGTGTAPKEGEDAVDTGAIAFDSPIASGTWQYFYKNYLLTGTDTFEDPNGGPYKLQIVTCTKNQGDNTCSIQRNTAQFESATGGTASAPPADNTAGQNYWVLVTRNSVCNGEVVEYNAGVRKITVAYKLEGGGTFCAGN